MESGAIGIALIQTNHESMVLGFPEQTVERQVSLVFCKAKVPKLNANDKGQD